MEGKKNRKVNCNIKFSLGVKETVNQGTLADLCLKLYRMIKCHVEGNGLVRSGHQTAELFIQIWVLKFILSFTLLVSRLPPQALLFQGLEAASYTEEVGMMSLADTGTHVRMYTYLSSFLKESSF